MENEHKNRLRKQLKEKTTSIGNDFNSKMATIKRVGNFFFASKQENKRAEINVTRKRWKLNENTSNWWTKNERTRTKVDTIGELKRNFQQKNGVSFACFFSVFAHTCNDSQSHSNIWMRSIGVLRITNERFCFVETIWTDRVWIVAEIVSARNGALIVSHCNGFKWEFGKDDLKSSTLCSLSSHHISDWILIGNGIELNWAELRSEIISNENKCLFLNYIRRREKNARIIK